MGIISQFTEPLVNKFSKGVVDVLGQTAQSIKSGLEQSTAGQIYSGIKQNVSDIANYAITQPTVVQPFQIQQKQITPTTITPTKQNNIPPPVVSANTSDVSAQAAALSKSLESIKEQLLNAQKYGIDESGNIRTEAPKQINQPQEPSVTERMWQSLMGQQKTAQEQIQQSQQNLVDQQNAIYEKWGLTPEKYQKIENLTTQIADYNKQLAAIETREQQALEAVGSRPGIDLAFMSGEQARISRAYAIQKSGVAAQASILASEANALQGNWDNAFKSAQLYVDNATKAQQQVVSDIKWGFDNYKDIISTMTTQEQKYAEMTLDYQTNLLKQQQDDYWNEINYKIKESGLELDWYKATNKTTEDYNELLSPTEAINLGVPYGTTKAQAFGITPLSAGTRKQLSTKASALSALEQVRTISEKVNTFDPGFLGLGRLTKGIINKIGAITQTNPDAAQLESQAGIMAQIVRGLGEVGTLATKDVDRVLKLIPGVFTGKELAKRNIEEIKTILESAQEGVIQGAQFQIGGQQKNAGSYEDYLNAIK